MKMQSLITVLTLPFLLCACPDQGSSTNPPSSQTVNSSPTYPSLKASVTSATSYMYKGQKYNYIYINTKDQNGNALMLDSKWTIASSVVCPDCVIDTSITVTSYGYDGAGSYMFAFPSHEDKNYQVNVTFAPSAGYTSYASDFPSGIPSSQTSGQALLIVNHDVCSDAPRGDLHGLRGTSKVDEVTRMAICDVNDLALVASDAFFLDKALYLAKDIDMSSYNAGGGAEFSIGDSCTGGGCVHFSGQFSGNFKTISHFQRTNGLGLFGIIEGGTVQNLILSQSTQSDLSANSSGGALASSLISGAIVNNVSILNSNITGTADVGGLVGTATDSSIVHSTASGTVSSNHSAGGLVAIMSSTGAVASSIVTSYTSNTVIVSSSGGSTTAYAGGLVAMSDSRITITDCYSTASVTSDYVAGGIIGLLNGSIERAYATGAVTADQIAGGLFGSSNPTGPNSVRSAFASNTVSSTGTSGGIGGECASLVADAIYYKDPLNPCGTSSNFTAGILRHSSSSTVSDILDDIPFTLIGYHSTEWSMSKTALPVLR